jgi:hypothetical protein
MTQFYGYRCYSLENKPLGWFYTYGSGSSYSWTNESSNLYWCKRWKTFKAAAKSFDLYNDKWKFGTKGGHLKIEIMPDFEIPISRTKLKKQEWNAANPDVIKESKAEYDRKCPILSFRPTSEIQAWLEEERYCDNDIPETTAALLNRKLEKLRIIENKGG